MFKKSVNAWKEYWEIMKLSLSWCKRHWKGYTLYCVICFMLPFVPFIKCYVNDRIDETFNKEEESQR